MFTLNINEAYKFLTTTCKFYIEAYKKEAYKFLRVQIFNSQKIVGNNKDNYNKVVILFNKVVNIYKGVVFSKNPHEIFFCLKNLNQGVLKNDFTTS